MAFAAALGLAFFIVRWWRNRPVEEVVASAPAAPLEPAHIVALRELDRIAKEAVWKQGQVKAHHAAVSDVLRTYFERRYNYPALERSTDELRKVIPSRGPRAAFQRMSSEPPYRRGRHG